MPTYPISPEPQTAVILPMLRESVRSQFDGGAISTRTKYLRRRTVQVTLGYLGTTNEYYTLLDFWDLSAGSVLPFEFNYPYPHTIVSIAAGTPPTVQTAAEHGYVTGELASVRDNTQQPNGDYRITRVDATRFSLDGQTLAITGTGGLTARYYPKMRFVGDAFGPFSPLPSFGAPVDAQGLTPWTVVLEESW